MKVTIPTPQLPVGDPGRVKECQDALEYRFGQMLSIAVMRVFDDARAAGWQDGEVREAILQLVEKHFNSQLGPKPRG
jgi:hypothetical protein